MRWHVQIRLAFVWFPVLVVCEFAIYENLKVLDVDSKHIWIGAKNGLYQLHSQTLNLLNKIDWISKDGDVQECKNNGHKKIDCHNYVRALAQINPNYVWLCGTNAFKPMCKLYEKSPKTSWQEKCSIQGVGIVASDPKSHSTTFYDKQHYRIYAATFRDQLSMSPIIYSFQFKTNEKNKNLTTLETIRNDDRVFKDPQFVGSFADADHVYFWFREESTECTTCEKTLKARIARVCKSDLGGGGAGVGQWTSYLKATLSCSIPSDYPFQFSYLQRVSGIARTAHGEIVYAAFSTPWNELRASAVCAYRMDEIRNLFNTGAFKVQKHADAQWSRVDASQLPKPRPGSCVNNSQAISQEDVHFVAYNNLLYDPVLPVGKGPLIVDVRTPSRYTAIAVHPGVNTINGKAYDVIFVGTEHGHVLQMIDLNIGDEKLVIIRDMRIFIWASVVELLLFTTTAQNSSVNDVKLLVAGRNELRLLSILECDQQKECSKCVHLRNPLCAWNSVHGRCEGRVHGMWPKPENYLQSVEDGWHTSCPT